MKIFCLSYSSFIFSIKNILIAMQLLIFFLLDNSLISGLRLSLAGWWAQMRFCRSFGCSATKCSSHFRPNPFGVWWAQMDSDHRPHAYQACALTSWAMSPYGGGNRVRTDDPLLAGQVLYQLSYTPVSSALGENKCSPHSRKALLIKNE